LAAFTPDPAAAFVTPLGRRSSGQILRHAAVQLTLLGFKV
jgi:hypothetical protein